MSESDSIDIERILPKLFQSNPDLDASLESQQLIRNKLQQQLIECPAIVYIDRLESECETKCDSIQAKITNLLMKKKQNKLKKSPQSDGSGSENLFYGDIPQPQLSIDSSDDEKLISIVARNWNKKLFHSISENKTEDNRTKVSRKRKTSQCNSKNKTCKKELFNRNDCEVSTSFVAHRTGVDIDCHLQCPNFMKSVIQPDAIKNASIPTLMFRQIVKDLIKKKEEEENRNLTKCQQSENEINQLLNDLLSGTNDRSDVETAAAIRSLQQYTENDNNCLQSSTSVVGQHFQSMIVKRPQKRIRKPKKPTNINSPQPPKKRRRKPKNNNIQNSTEQPSSTKSNLAQYVESFGNDCYLPGSATPMASSGLSPAMVTSTTQNYDVVEQQGQTFTCLIDWTNDQGACQLIQLNPQVISDLPLDPKDINQEETNPPFQDFVNFIENNNDDNGNNLIARVLNGSNTSVPLSSTNMPIFQVQQQQPTHLLNHQPIINIQIPPLTSNVFTPTICVKDNNSIPPPAHTKINAFYCEKLNDDQPLDLSIKSTTNSNCQQLILESSIDCTPTTRSQQGPADDDEFILELIKSSNVDSDIKTTELGDYNNNASFKAALSMPELDYLEEEIETPKSLENSTLNKDNSVIEQSTFENELQFADESTKEIFNELLQMDITTNSEHELSKSQEETLSFLDVSSASVNLANDTTAWKESEMDVQKEIDNPQKITDHEQNISKKLKQCVEKSNKLSFKNFRIPRIAKTCNWNKKKAQNELANKSPLVANIETEISKAAVTEFKCDELLCTNSNPSQTSNKKESTEKQQSDMSLYSVDYLSEKFCYESSSEEEYSDDKSNNLYNLAKTSKFVYLTPRVKNVPQNRNDESHTESTTIKSVDFNTKEMEKQNFNEDLSKLYSLDENNGKTDDSDSQHLHNCLQNIIEPNTETENEKGKDMHVNDNGNGSVQDLQCVDTAHQNDNKPNSQEITERVSDNMDYTSSLYANSSPIANEQMPEKLHEHVLPTKNKDEIDLQRLSILETELKFHEDLDFEADDDDALSLTASSLNSPNDDRFSDSNLYCHKEEEEVSAITIASCSNALTNPNANISQESLYNKPFRIPKFEKSGGPLNADEFKNNNDANNNNATAFQNNSNSTSSSLYYSKLSSDESDLFGIDCFPCLQNRCDIIAHFKANKPLQDNEKVYQYLKKASKTELYCIYQFMYGNYKLYQKYFNTFFNFYLSCNNTSMLLSMINDCKRYPDEYSKNLILLYESLVRSGVAREKACQMILPTIRDASITDALVAQFTKIDSKFRIVASDEMSTVVLQTKEYISSKESL